MWYRLSRHPFAFAGLSLFIIAMNSCSATETVATLSGTWSGTWTDARESYGHNGGDFTCVAVESKPGTWRASFSLGATKTFDVELSGKTINGEIRFDTTADLGKFHGVYTLKGTIKGDAFTGDYSGKDELGTFKMTRKVDAKKE
jgi:hypothetical protein